MRVKGSALSYYLCYTLLCFNKVWKKDGTNLKTYIRVNTNFIENKQTRLWHGNSIDFLALFSVYFVIYLKCICIYIYIVCIYVVYIII